MVDTTIERTVAGTLLPGIVMPEPGLETYWVRPGGVTGIPLDPGDQVVVVDRFGRQDAELTLLEADGRTDGGGLGVRHDAPATVLREVARRGDPFSVVMRELSRHPIDPSELRATLIFGESTPAGSREEFACSASAILLVAAPSRPVSVLDLEMNPPSDLLVEVRRAEQRAAQPQELPAPLAEPLLDLRIDKATAASYEVKEGQYIQVIDVEGKQCSDFLAFNSRALEGGLERGLDGSVTRTLMGNSFPQPGLFGKFFDQDMNPLIEVVRDTVGRHDTFALACYAKYYEDLGYPGHPNCTDNFNAAIDRYSIAPRPGWPGLNLFYNTRFDEHELLVADEPWSRPGDYVLMRAMTDLVCASSACPDDIDPSNAWTPTDIHIRVYDSKRKFSMAVATRVTPDAPTELTKESGFHSRTSALTKQFSEFRGYWLPDAFDDHGAVEEYWACRERVAVIDLTPLRKFEVLGPDAERLLNAAVTRNIRKLSHGEVVYSAMCNETGGMLDDCTVFRMNEHNFRFVGGEEYDGVWLTELAGRLGLNDVWVKPSTDSMHNIAVQGPRSRDLLAKIIWTPPTHQDFVDLNWFRFCVGRLHGPKGTPVVVSRTGYSGELGYEVWCAPSDAETTWDAVFAAGAEFGVTPLGMHALDMLRIESGLVFGGFDFDDQTDPFEAGIGFTVPLKTKDADFVGRDALLERKEYPQRKLVGLELHSEESISHGDRVYVGRSQVGVITSATRSPLLDKNIALCRIAVQHAALGGQVEVGMLDGHQKRLAASVVPFPFYDPKKEKPRS